jgi:hypothetical protein
MPGFTRSKGALALVFLAAALASGCAPANGTKAEAAAAAEPAKPSPCVVMEKFDAGSYNGTRVIDFDTDQVVYKIGYGESGVAATPFTQLTPRAQQKMETLRKTLPAHCQ